jgi:hypothetical protein
MNHKARVASFGVDSDDGIGVASARIEELSNTAPDKEVSAAENNPSALDRLIPVGRTIFLRNQLSIQRKKLLASRARAQDMIARFELSEVKCTDLSKMSTNPDAPGCKRVVAVTGTPQFTAALSTKQAMKAIAQKESAKGRKPRSAEDDPLLTERERHALEKQREIEQRKRCIHFRVSPAGQLTSEPAFAAWAGDPMAKSKETESSTTQLTDAIKSTSTPWLVKGVNRARPAIVVRTSKLGGKGMLNISPGSPSSDSVAPTEANTPSPRLQPSFGSIDGRSSGRPRFSSPLHSLC